MQTVEISTRARCEPVDITSKVQAAVSESGVMEGMAVICSAHTTAGITVNEHADPDVIDDVMAALARLAPPNGPYAHAEGNSDAHIKAALLGPSVTLPVSAKRLVLGTWQGIFFCEFDGPRRRRATVQVIPSA